MNSSLGAYRLGGGRVVGWWIIALMTVMAAAALFTESGRNRIISLALCAVVVCISYLLGVRPAVMEFPEELRVLNPLRTVHIPWPLITQLVVKDVVVVETTITSVRCYGLPRRDRRSAAATINSAINSRIPAVPNEEPPAPNISRAVVDAIEEHAQSLSTGMTGSYQIARTFDRDVLAALAVIVVAAVCIGISVWA